MSEQIKFPNDVLIVSQCEPGMVTHPKLDAFQAAVGADVWHHIAVPPMSTEEFYQLVGQVHTYIQSLLDKRKEPSS